MEKKLILLILFNYGAKIGKKFEITYNETFRKFIFSSQPVAVNKTNRLNSSDLQSIGNTKSET